MAARKPLVVDGGRIQQLQAGDTLELAGVYGGAVSIEYEFSTTTTDSDPGDGVLRLDNATQNAATTLRMDDLDVNGVDWSGVISGTPPLADALNGDSGYLRVVARDDPSAFLVFELTQATAETGYSNVAGSVIASSGASPFADGDPVVAHYTRNGVDGEDGNDGAPGADGDDANVTPGTTDNAIVRADGTSNDTIQGSTATIGDDGVLTVRADSSLETSGSHDVIIAALDSAGSTSFSVTAFLRSTGNLGVGDGCLDAVTTGQLNFALGQAAGGSVSTGNSNTLIGSSAGVSVSTGGNNVCIGTTSASNLAGGNNNVCIGVSTASALTSGGSVIAIGTNAVDSASTAGANVGIGVSALQNATNANNTAVGYFAGQDIGAGSGNTFLGYFAGNNASQLVTATNSTAIGNGAFTTASNQVVLGNSSVTETILRGVVDIDGGATVGAAVRQNAGATAQTRTTTLTGQTTDGSTINLVDADGVAALPGMPEDSYAYYDVRVTAIRSDGSEGASYTMTGAIRRDGAATPAFVSGTFTRTVIAEDDAGLDTDLQANANGFHVRATGVAAKTFRWAATAIITLAAV